MELISIIAILSSIIIGSVIWLKKSIQQPINIDENLLNELNDKREKIAAIPFLNQQISELINHEGLLKVALDEHRDKISQRDIQLTKLEKDIDEKTRDIIDLENKIFTLEQANKEAHQSLLEKKTESIDLNNMIKMKENEMLQVEQSYKKDIEILKAKNQELLSAIDSLNKNLANTLSLIDETKNNLSRVESKNSEFKANIDAKEQNINDLNTRIKKLDEELNNSKAKIDFLTENNAQVREKNSELESSLNAQQENNQKLKIEFEEQGKKLELKLNEIMQNNLESKLKKFDETSIKSLDSILKPFKENIESFKKKIEDSQESSVKKFAELSKEIEQVTKAGMNISKEAENLTKALKGKKQTQGSWGEMILESVLEYSGLLKNVHYHTQQSYKDEQGSIKRPDVIIKLPQERTMIIDSKVSLNDYDDYIRAETEEERMLSISNMVVSFKNHIDTLDSKDYAHYKIGTLQYVFMFVPIEGAFALAVQRDPTLYEYALKKHIAIVNPSTLTVSLRTIYLYWQSEQSNSLTTKLFDEAGKLYDKMVGYAENFNKIGNQIKTLSSTYEITHKQLSEGSGNILGRVENLKRLGAKASKTLKDSKIEFQDFDDSYTETIMVVDEELLLDNKTN